MTYSELIKNCGASSTEKALEQRARRMAKRRGLAITKINPRSRWFNTYGPYMIVNDRNGVESYGDSIEEVINYLAGEKV